MTIRKTLLITLILNSIIIVVIPSGHGGGLMIMLETLCIPLIIENGIKVKSEHPFESNLLFIILLSLIGKVILVINLLLKEIYKYKKSIYFGLTLMIIAFIFIVIGILKYDYIILLITIGSGIPFLIYFWKLIKEIQKEIT